MPSFSTQQSRLSQLVWQLYGWHLLVGLLIWTSAVLPFVFFQYLKEKASMVHEPFYADNLAAALRESASNYILLAFMLIIGGFALAVVGGLIQYCFLQVVAKNACTRNELIWRSLIVFELVVLLASFIPWPIAYNQFSLLMVGHQYRATFVISLPWLIATGLASRKIASSLDLPRSVD